MNHAPSKPGWFAALRAMGGRGAAPADFADMGTAFGLDASMWPDVAAAEAAEAPVSASGPTDDRFERRLVRRNWA